MTLDEIAALEALWADANQDTPWQTFEAKDGSEDFIHLCDDDGAPVAWLEADDAGRCNGLLIARVVSALPDLLALARRGLEHDRGAERGAALLSDDAPAVSPEPGANPLDTEAVRRTIAACLDHPSVYMGGPSRQSQAHAQRVVAALAPHVAAAQRAAFLRGREAGRDDAVQACQRYAAREREARDAAHELCDDAEEADCARAVHVAEGVAAYVEMLGPVEDADDTDAPEAAL